MPIIANTTSANTFSAVRAQLNSVTKRINQFAVNESAIYANTINANVSLKISGTDIRATFAQNTYVKSVLANTNAYIAAQATRITLVNTNLTGTNSALRTLINDRLQVANAVATYQTKAVERAALANTNAYIAAQATRITLVNSNLTGTNSALRTLISDRLQVANAAAVYQTKAVERAALANTNAYIGNQATRITLVNTNLTGTNTALRALINDRLQVGNVAATYQTIVVERAALANTNAFIRAQLANTNAYIAGQATRITLVNTNLTGTNAALRTLISDRLQVANAVGTYQTKVIERAALANTNAYIATKTNTTTFNSALANTNSFIKSQLANTNSYIGDQATRITLVNTNLTGTNTALRTLISDRYQVANVNTLLATKATWTALTGTNTAIRALVSDRLQVANAATLYATKSNPTTSGVLAHTGRASVSTNLSVTGNTTVTGTLINLNNPVTVTTNAGTVSASYRVSTFTNSSAATMTITLSTTGAIDAQMIMVRIYDFSAAAQTIAWVNTENSNVSVPTTSNGSTTLPLTVGFMYNAATSKWRCIASA